MNNHIVIIGGMGPQASVFLHRLVVKKHGAQCAPDTFPAILHISLPVPDFISSTDATSEAVRIIQDACHALPLDSAGAIGIACNTAHLLIDQLNTLPKRQFVSMIDAVVDDIIKAGHRKVGLLASPSTIKSRLYHDALEKNDIEVIEPSAKDTDTLAAIIRDVIGNAEPTSLKPQLTAIAQRLQKQGADCILLGCTELPLVGITSSLPTINSLSSLADRLLERVS
jgi:aspartate racemase